MRYVSDKVAPTLGPLRPQRRAGDGVAGGWRVSQRTCVKLGKAGENPPDPMLRACVVRLACGILITNQSLIQDTFRVHQLHPIARRSPAQILATQAGAAG